MFHPDEVRLKNKFLAVPLGTTESRLEAELGKPTGRIVYDHSKHSYVYAEQEGNKRLVKIDSGVFASSTDIPAADCFVIRDPSESTLVHNEARVFGYFYSSKMDSWLAKKSSFANGQVPDSLIYDSLAYDPASQAWKIFAATVVLVQK